MGCGVQPRVNSSSYNRTTAKRPATSSGASSEPVVWWPAVQCGPFTSKATTSSSNDRATYPPATQPHGSAANSLSSNRAPAGDGPTFGVKFGSLSK